MAAGEPDRVGTPGDACTRVAGLVSCPRAEPGTHPRQTVAVSVFYAEVRRGGPALTVTGSLVKRMS